MTSIWLILCIMKIWKTIWRTIWKNIRFCFITWKIWPSQVHLSKGKIDFPCAKLEFILPCFDKPKTCYLFQFIATQRFVCSIKSKRKLQVSCGLASVSQFLLRSKFCIAGTIFYCFIIIHIMHQNAWCILNFGLTRHLGKGRTIIIDLFFLDY